jgi:hypothetical protein
VAVQPAEVEVVAVGAGGGSVEVGQLIAGLGDALAEVAVDQRLAAATRLPLVRRRLLVMACTGGSGVVDAGWM